MSYLDKLIERFIRFNRRLKRWQRVVSVLSAIVVFVTTYSLILPAITLDKDTASTQAGMEIAAASENELNNDGTIFEAEPEDEPEAEEQQAETVEESQAEETVQEESGSDSGSQEANVSEEDASAPEENEEISDAGETSETTEPTEEIQLISEKTQILYQYIDESFEKDPKDDVDDGYTVYAEFDAAAKLPVGVELKVKEITKESDPDLYEVYYEKALSGLQDKYDENTELSFARFYDIKFMHNNVEVEPGGEVKIRIEYRKAVEIEEETNVDTVHFDKKKDEEPEVIDSEIEAEKKGRDDTVKTVEFESDQFSVYGIIGSYTVDFQWEVDGNVYEFSIPGGGFITLEQLVEVLDIAEDAHAFVADVEEVEFSDPELVWSEKVEEDTTVGELKEANELECEYSDDLSEEQIAEINAQTVEAGDWALISVHPFDSEETLTVTMKNGEQFEIKVTDAREISDSSAGSIDANKSYLICYEADGQYYLLKNDGSVDSSHTPDGFDDLNSTYCWTFNYVFEEKHLEDTLTYIYYLIRPIDNLRKTIALNAEGDALVQESNNNVAVIPAEGGGFNLIGYNEVKLNFENGEFSSKEFPAGNNGIVVHIYEMDTLPTYNYTARANNEGRGTVTIGGGTQKEKTLDDGTVVHYFEAESNPDKMNAGTITATPLTHPDVQGHNKWIFDHWEQDGTALDRETYPASIAAETLPIPFNGSELVALFKQNPEYIVPDNEKEPSSIVDMSGWLEDLSEKHVPLDEEATGKTAEVYDYENRIYRVDITSKSNFKTFKGDVDMAFCMDVSNSMYFPSKLIEHTTLSIYQINENPWNKNWLDRSRNWNNPYYLIADPANTATVFKVYFQNGSWKAQDASRESESDRSFVIGQSFHTNWCTDDRFPFNAGDDRNTQYVIYNAGDEGRNRFYYLNQAFSGATSDLTTIKNLLEVAGDESPDVLVAYNTFNLNLGNQGQDFQPVQPISGIDLSNSHGGGTRPDQAFINAQSFNWKGDDRYVILITDGAPQGKRDGEPDNDFERISQAVRNSAAQLKNQSGVKFITIGLSMDSVPHGKKLLYDLADEDQDGNRMFFMAESASDLPNILRQVIDTIMDDAIVMADVTDTVGEAFYLVDKETGLPLKAGDKITIEGRLTTDDEDAAGIVQPDGVTVKWTDQAVDSSVGWHGAIYVKAKEDLIGGNAVVTNTEADIEATKYKIEDTEISFVDVPIGEKLKSLKIEFPTPRVNVNELMITKESSEWTVYLGTEVDPNTQLKHMYEDAVVNQVLNEEDSLLYELAPNSIADNREDQITGTAKTLNLAAMILELIKADPELSALYVKNNELDWDKFLEDIQRSEGVTVPYHAYGIEGDDSNINITLIKDILDGEETDLVNRSPHDTTVVNGTDPETGDVPVEKYVLTVQYNPDYENVLPAGQGGHGHYEYHTGTFGTMYQGHAAGRETCDNTHVINVYAEPLDVLKLDDNEQPRPVPGAEFKLYREAKTGEEGVSLSSYNESLTGSYYCISTATSDDNGIVHLAPEDLTTPEHTIPVAGGQLAQNLLVKGETYYLIETSVPTGYKGDNIVRTVEVEAGPDFYTQLDKETPVDSDDIDETTQRPKIAFNWNEGVVFMVNELGSDEDSVPAETVNHETRQPVTLTDEEGNIRTYMLRSDSESAVVFQIRILNGVISSVDIQKLDDDGIGLEGAVFQLKHVIVNEQGVKEESDIIPEGITGIGDVTKTVDGQQVVYHNAFETTGQKQTLGAMPNGIYRIYEVYVPDGYIKTFNYVEFTIEDWTIKDGSVTTNTGDTSKVELVKEQGSLALLKVTNTAGAELPEAGGPGTSLFMILGLIMIAGSGVLLWKRRFLNRSK